MSADLTPLTADEIAGIRARAEDEAAGEDHVWSNHVILRLCAAAESVTAKDAEIAALRAVVEDMGRVARERDAMRQRAEKAEADARRYRWAKPIFAGDDEGDALARVLAKALMAGEEDIDAVIDRYAATQSEAKP